MKHIALVCVIALFPLQLRAQDVGSVAGVVTDQVTGAPLVGVQVTVPGTRLAATTGSDGRFLIERVPVGQATVRARTIGYGSAEQVVTVTAGATATVTFLLERQAVQLEEQVVIGYGEQQRQNVTGAVASVTSADFVQGPARDAASLVAGRIAGLAVIQPSGNPTETAEIQLRGITTIQGPRSPLILVDGIPGNLQTVPAGDIESISVLKDGSAAAIYGSRASNGVILITTKRHTSDRATLRYDGHVSQSTIYKRPDFMTASDYRLRIGEGYLFQDLGHNTDWQSQVLRNPLSYLHNLSLSGGTLNTNYNASLNLESEEGIFQRSDNNEVTARANIRHQMFDGKLEAEASVLSRTQTSFLGPNYDYVWRQTLIRNPTDRVKNDSGRWVQTPGYFYVNPVSLIDESQGEDETRLTRLHATVTLRPIERLRLSLMGGTSRSNWLRGFTTSFGHPDNTEGNNGGLASRTTNSVEDRILEITGTYANQFGQHNVTVLGGYGYQDNLFEDFFAGNTRFPTDIFEWNRLQLGDGLLGGEAGASINSNKTSFKVIGFFGRVNYDWKNRYLLMASVRHEGNSRFGAAHKWGVFPAVSAGWRISEEPFMDGLPFLDDLRLRVGYGVTGIAPDSSYRSLRSYAYGQRFFYEGRWVRGLAPARNPNPDLRWEEKHEINVGLNFSAFDSRLNGTVDVYRRDTKDMLYNYAVPVPPNLTGSLLANVGVMRNNGLELELSYDVLSRPGLRWTTSANWSRNSNRLVRLSNDLYKVGSDPNRYCFQPGGSNSHTGEPIQQSTHQVCVGQPIGNFYGFESVDVDSTGRWIVLNAAGQRIPYSQARQGDRRVLGNGYPKQHVAWNNTAQVGPFDLSASLRGSFDFQVLNFMRMYYENPRNTQYNMLRSAFDSVYGKARLSGDLAYVSYYVEDGDYIKLDNVTLGYTLSQGALGRFSRAVSSARIYVTGRNLLTLTRYKGLDPEVTTTAGNGLAPGNDSRDTYPTIRTFTAGMTLTF